MQKKIILIEDGDLLGKKLNQSLIENYYSITKISDPNEVKDFLIDRQPKIVIIDPYAFSSYGFHLIDLFLKDESAPVVLAMSEKRDSDVIIGLMKSGLYDYIILDRESIEIEHKIKNAFDASELQRLRKLHDKELRVLNGYFSLRNTGGKRKHSSEDAALISSIRTNFSQGSGIGSIISVISMIAKYAIEKDDHFTVDKNLLNMLFDNSKDVQRLIEAFENLENFSNQTIELQMDSIDSMYAVINEQINQIERIGLTYGKTIQINENNHFSDKYINWIPSYFEFIIRELLLNAIKYSPKNTKITILTENVDHGLLVSVLNEPDKNYLGDVGIPNEFQNLIFEPFFRLSRVVFEDIPTLDYGLGLTLVNLLVKKMRGYVRISNLESYISIGSNPRKLISMEIWLPVYSKTFTGIQKKNGETDVLLENQPATENGRVVFLNAGEK